MKHFLLITCLLLFLTTKLESPCFVFDKETHKEHIELYLEYKEIQRQVTEIKKFLYVIGERESSNDWTRWNIFGYFGKYQFGRSALVDLGYSHITFRKFLENPNIFPEMKQEYIMLKNMYRNYKRIDKRIKPFNISYNDYFNITATVPNRYDYIRWGIPITMSGLLGGAHLGGAQGVLLFFMYGINRFDANHTHISDYIQLLNHYHFDDRGLKYMINKYHKKAQEEKLLILEKEKIELQNKRLKFLYNYKEEYCVLKQNNQPTNYFNDKTQNYAVF